VNPAILLELLGRYRKAAVAAIAIAAAVIHALYPANVPPWALVITAAATALGVAVIPNAPTSTSTRTTSPAAAPESPFNSITSLQLNTTDTVRHVSVWGAGHSCDSGGAPHEGQCVCECGVPGPTPLS
jgi:hypothetical protein